MELGDLIDEYKSLPKICNQIDYSNKSSVIKNNKAVDRMYKIVDTINLHFGKDGVEQFQKLLDIKDSKINVWAATHLLEKLNPDKKNTLKALKIIEQIAKGKDIEALGFSYWLKEWKFKNKN